MASGRLYVVATPIGNLEDITTRALRVLAAVDRIAAEDTRHSRKLLERYGVGTPTVSYHDHNEAARTTELIGTLESGKDVALICDAGTPCVSDPGYRLVQAAHEHEIEVIAVPGPSAMVAALSVSGLPNHRVTFHGFFPRKRGDCGKLFAVLRSLSGTHVFFESPRRLKTSLERIAEEAPDADVCVARELTKQFEQVVRGRAKDVRVRFQERPVRGECVVLLHMPDSDQPHELGSVSQLQDLVRETMDRDGMSQRDAIRKVAADLDIPRNQVYAAMVRKP
jgi:16S rRNA (cytidine1402-2'-O)-methyltransferase